MPTVDAGPVTVRAASPALSLAWKLFWLETDAYPQGKDLYDAILLAEETTVDWSLVTRLLARELHEHEAAAFTPARVREWEIDPDNFHDHPHLIGGDVAEWTEQLAVALERSYRPGS